MLIFAQSPSRLAQQRANEVRTQPEPIDADPARAAGDGSIADASPRRAIPVPGQTRAAADSARAGPQAAPAQRAARSADGSCRASRRRARRASTAPEPPTGRAAAPKSRPAKPNRADRRQLDYANGLFARKLYDLAVPEYEKFLGQFPGASGRASAYFYLGECYRALNRTPAARTSFQSVLDEHPESEFAGPAAYGVAEILFNQKDYAGALPLFHRSAAKTKEPALALSARYFEARCLENLNRKDEAANLYLQVVEAKNPNPYREDSRMAAGSILLARGRRAEALRQYEALANETAKAAVESGSDGARRNGRGRFAAGATEASPTRRCWIRRWRFCRKAARMPEAGSWRGIAEVGLAARCSIQTGQHAQVVAEYKRGQAQMPEEVRAEMMLAGGEQRASTGPRQGSRGALLRRSSRSIRTARKRKTRAISA